MPYTITWHIENRVLLITVSGAITLEEFEQLHRDAFQYVIASPHRVHAIVDVTRFEAAPRNLRMMLDAASEDKSDNQGMTVLMTPNMPKMLHFLVSVILQTLRLEFRVVETMPEAMETLHRVDTALMQVTEPAAH